MQKHIISLFWRTAMRYPVRTSLALIGSATTAIVGGYLGPYIISQLLERLQQGTVSFDTSLPLILAYVATQLYGEVIGWRINMYLIWTMETAAQRHLYERIFTKLTEQSLSFHADRFGGALVSQTTKLIGSFERFWDTIMFQIIPTAAGISAAIIILSFLFWQYALFLLTLVIIFTISIIFGSRFMLQRNREEAQASTATTAHVADAITNIATIKAHGHERTELERLNEKTAAWRGKSLATMRGFLGVSTGYSSLIATVNIVALLAAIGASQYSLASLGVIYLAITYTFTVARQLWDMNSIMRSYNRIMGDAHDMTEILRSKPGIRDTSTQLLKAGKGDIAIKSIDFSHNQKTTLFESFDLHVRAGERVGLVGHSGSGKTSLTKLLLRFADVSKGAILIDNQDISEVTQESLRKAIAYVPQEPMLFHRTLRDNIAYGKPEATEAEIIEAARQANALEFIKMLPEGFETMVGERGVKLSGGQRQRIAIARAILKDAPILILDEATSALDSESEKLIQDALDKLMKGRTSIVIAHRLSTIAKLDRIIVLDQGRITEDGTHTELLRRKGTYAKLWSHQSGGFIEE